MFLCLPHLVIVMIVPWWRKHACEACGHLLLRSSRILSQPPCYHRRRDSTTHGRYHHHDLYFHPIIQSQTLPGYLSHICCTSATFKRWPRSSASICSFDPQISKDAVRDISKDGSWSLSWIKELVFWTPFQKLPQSEMSVIASYRNFCSKRLGLLCQCACNSAGHLYIFIVLSNTCYLCDSWW